MDQYAHATFGAYVPPSLPFNHELGPTDRQVLAQGTIFVNTSLTEAFGIAILEAACTGLYVVSTRVGGIPEILPEDMISFANPDEDGKPLNPIHSALVSDFFLDVVRAISDAVRIVSENQHNPEQAHERISKFYSWEVVAERTEVVYQRVHSDPGLHIWDRLQKYVISSILTTAPD